MTIKNRIIQNKLLLLYHLVNLKACSLAKQIFLKQKEKNLVGPVREMSGILRELSLPDIINLESLVTKNQWKCQVKRAILRKNESEVKEKLLRYRKLEDDPILEENFCKKTYLESLNLIDSRLMYRIRSKTTGAKMNMKSSEKFSKELWKCEDCGNIDSQSHILWCPAYSPQREGKNISDEKDIVEYFREVFQFRENFH